MRRYECVLIYVNGLYRENVTFEVEYEMQNAAMRYNDCSELYLSMYSGNTIKHLKSYRGQILVPKSIMPDSGNYTAHTFGTIANDFEFQESDSLNPGHHTFSFVLNENQLKFRPYNQYIEFNLVSFGGDKHIFTKNAPIGQYYYYNYLPESIEEQEKYDSTPKYYNKIKLTILSVSILVSAVVIYGTVQKDKNMNKRYKFYKPETEFIYYRDIPSDLDPIFASELALCRKGSKKKVQTDYAAIMLSLIRKKYIELERINTQKDWDKNNIKIIIKYNRPVFDNPIIVNALNYAADETSPTGYSSFEPLFESEKLLFNLIFKYAINNELTLTNFQNKLDMNYEVSDTFVKDINKIPTKIGMEKNYIQKIDYKAPQRTLRSEGGFDIFIGIVFMLINIPFYYSRISFAFGSFFLIGLSFMLSGFYKKHLSYNYALLTQFGEDEFEKWFALYSFLNSETLMKERTVIELPLWEKYLIYATAFGISEKVIKALKIRCPEMDIQNSSSVILRNHYFRSHSFYSHSRSIRSSAYRSSHIASSGGYGGYGGGGRGGGGGGGGH